MVNQANSYTITPEEQLAMAGQMREEKRGKDKGTERESEAGSEKKTLRQSVIAARQAMDIKARAKEKIEEKVMMPARQGTNWLLRWAWATLIPSFGLTLIYINMHVFLKAVLGEKLFCKLGDEWIPKQVQAVGGEAGKMGGRAIGIVEVMGLLLLDLVALFLILGLLTLFIILADVASSPIQSFIKGVWYMAHSVWSYAWGSAGEAFQTALDYVMPIK